MHQNTRLSLVQVIACRPFGAKAILWTNVGLSLIVSLYTNFSEFLIEIRTFLLKKMNLKMASAKW